MNHNGEKLEKAGNNNCNLSNSEDKHRRRHTFVTKTRIGKCPCCEENVYEDQLFVEERNITYHYSCYNYKKAEEKSD